MSSEDQVVTPSTPADANPVPKPVPSDAKPVPNLAPSDADLFPNPMRYSNSMLRLVAIFRPGTMLLILLLFLLG